MIGSVALPFGAPKNSASVAETLILLWVKSGNINFFICLLILLGFFCVGVFRNGLFVVRRFFEKINYKRNTDESRYKVCNRLGNLYPRKSPQMCSQEQRRYKYQA